MHEVSLMQAALDLALDHAANQGAQHLHRLKLRVGTLSGVVPEALEFAFDLVTAGTIAAGATLELETLPALCYCSTCQVEFQPPDWIYECPRCHQFTAEVRQGRELELVSLEVS